MQPACSQADTRTGSSGWVSRAHTPESPCSDDSSGRLNGDEGVSSSHTAKGSAYGSTGDQGKHSRSTTPTPSWKSHSQTTDWPSQTFARGMVRSKSCCEGQLGEDSLAAIGERVRWGGCGSNATSHYSGLGGRGGGSWGESQGLQRSSSGHKPRHVRRNSADSGSSWRHTGRTTFGGEPRHRLRSQKGLARVGSWEDCLSREDATLGEKFLWEETSRKLSLKSSFMPKIECKLEEMPQASEKLIAAAHGPERGVGRRATRKPSSSRNRTSRFIGVGASNRKNQWQARILVHGKVTHLGYYRSEEEAAMIYDRVAISLNPGAATNFPASRYVRSGHAEFAGLTREELQRALGVKPMDKSSVYKGVSRKKGKWEAKVMVNRKWAYRALFDSEVEAARAYDSAVWRLKPREASSFVNFKSDGISRKRSSDAIPSLTRTKSQKRNSPAFADVAPPDPQGNGAALTLDLAHIPQVPLQQELEAGDSAGELQELKTPSTPSRSHSVQLPLSGTPLPMGEVSTARGVGLVRAASSYVLPEVMQNYRPIDPLEMFPLPAPGDCGGQIGGHMLEVSQPYPCAPAFTSLPALTLGGAAVLNLPDPNSIGVPPPNNLPFPELVKQPLATSASAECLPSRHSSGSIHHLMGMEAPALGLTSRRPSLQSVPSGLPEIPPPLLPTAVMLNREGLGMEACWPAHASKGLMPKVDMRSQSSSPHPQQNPFEEAATLLPPITSQPSTLLPPLTSQPSTSLVGMGSEEALQTAVYASRPVSLHKLKSMPDFLGTHQSQTLQVLPRLPSADQCMLAKAVSDDMMRSGNAFQPSLNLAQGGMMMGGFPGFGSGSCLQRQQSIPEMLAGGVPLMSSVGTPLDLSHLPKSMFEPAPTNEGQCNGSSFAPMEALTPSMHGHSSTASGLTCLPEISSMSGHLPRCMSNSSLLHPLQGQQGGSGLSSVCQPQHSAMNAAPHPLGDCGLAEDSQGAGQMDTDASQPICQDATDILAELGVNTREPDGVKGSQLDLQSVQIGGDNLHTYDSVKMAGDSFLLGGDL